MPRPSNVHSQHLSNLIIEQQPEFFVHLSFVCASAACNWVLSDTCPSLKELTYFPSRVFPHRETVQERKKKTAGNLANNAGNAYEMLVNIEFITNHYHHLVHYSTPLPSLLPHSATSSCWTLNCDASFENGINAPIFFNFSAKSSSLKKAKVMWTSWLNSATFSASLLSLPLCVSPPF